MGLFDKVKNMFMDEVEDEVKTGMIQVEIPAPAKKEEETEIADNKIIKTEEKPTTPIFFDDEYFKELESPKPEIKSSYRKEKPVSTEKKIFKPTPIISPVYGVLDKNYHKEEITSKSTKRTDTDFNISIDDIRKKAFGTLEDDLETTLFGNQTILYSEKKVKEDKPVDTEISNDLFEEMTQ